MHSGVKVWDRWNFRMIDVEMKIINFPENFQMSNRIRTKTFKVDQFCWDLAN